MEENSRSNNKFILWKEVLLNGIDFGLDELFYNIDYMVTIVKIGTLGLGLGEQGVFRTNGSASGEGGNRAVNHLGTADFGMEYEGE